jgi:hypothetical protein
MSHNKFDNVEVCPIESSLIIEYGAKKVKIDQFAKYF